MTKNATMADHLSAYLMAHPGPVFAWYRRKVLEQIRADYGIAIAAEVEATVRAKWAGPDRPFCPPGNPACSACQGCPGGKGGTGLPP